MKQTATMLLSLFLLCCALFAQQPSQTTMRTNEGATVTRHVLADGEKIAGVAAAKAGIVVTDINFGTRPVGLPALIDDPFHVTNRGNAALRITKHSGIQPSSMATVFDIADLKSQKFPLIIDTINSGFNQQTFHVTFTPPSVGTFNATITFSSNGAGIDSVCRLRGIGISPGIGVNGMEFGRRRVGGKYDSDVEGGPAQIMISNSLGNVMSTINSVKISGATTEFEVSDISDLVGKSMSPAEQIIRGIKFTPKKIGYDTLFITLGVSTGPPVVFIATGVGVVPKLQLPNIDFGRVDLNGTTLSVKKNFHLVNLDVTTTPSYEFYDDALFDDLGSAIAGQIGSGGQTDVGSKGFSFDLKQFDLPFALAAGATSWDFSAWYRPSKLGFDTARFYYSLVGDGTPSDTTHTLWTGEAYEGVNAVIDEATDLHVYPVPAQNVLHLHFATSAARVYTILDDLSRTRMQYQSDASSTEVLDLSGLAAGSYTLTIAEGNALRYKRFVKL